MTLDLRRVVKIGRRGQLGKLMTSFPVMIGIFLVMGLYLFLASGASVNKPESSSSLSSAKSGLTIQDALKRLEGTDKGKAGEQFETFLIEYVRNNYVKGDCVFLFEGNLNPLRNEGEIVILEYGELGGKDFVERPIWGDSDSIFGELHAKGLYRNYEFKDKNGDKRVIFHYEGRCDKLDFFKVRDGAENE
jgi:hypothetical protein